MQGPWIGLFVVIAGVAVILWRRAGSTPSMAMWSDISETIPRLQRAAASNVHHAGEDTVASAAMAKQTAVLRETIRFIYTIARDGDHVNHVISSQLVARKPEKYQVESMLVAMLALTRQLKAAGIEGDQGRFEVDRSEAGTHFMGLLLTAEEHERFMSAGSARA